jgi:hypothetical protein
MSLYRWFKTQVYWLIPDSFKSQNLDEFSSDLDLVTVYKYTDENGVYENKKVSISQLSNLVSGEAGPSTFDVSTTGPLTVSVNEGAYSSGPSSVAMGGNFTLAAQTLPTGLNWNGAWDVDTEYSNSDVVYNVDLDVYTTWVYINETPSTGESLPLAPATYNTYWAQLGTQGPSGSNGVTALNGVTGNTNISTGSPVFSVADWRLDIVGDSGSNQVITKVNKPYKEFNTRINMVGSTSIPSAVSLIANAAVNEFGLVPGNLGISQTQSGQIAITFPSGTLSTSGNKNVLTVTQDVDLTYATSGKLFMIKFNMSGFASASPTVGFQVYMWNPSTSAWTTSFQETVSLRLILKKYN